LALTLL
jgi:transketolase